MTTPTWKNRVQETSTTAGNGNFMLNGATVGYKNFFDSVGLNTLVEYGITNKDVPAEWEIGLGVLVGSSQFQRQTVYDGSSGIGATVNFSAGTKTIYITLSAESIRPDANFLFIQDAPLSSWSIPHNLGKKPSVTVTDSAGTQVYGEVVYVDNNNVTINFTAGFSGNAYLN